MSTPTTKSIAAETRADQVLDVIRLSLEELENSKGGVELTPLQKSLLNRVMKSPNNSAALRDAAFVFLNALGMPEVAKTLLQKARTLDPENQDLILWLRVAEDAAHGSSVASGDLIPVRSHYGQSGGAREKPRPSDVIRLSTRFKAVPHPKKINQPATVVRRAVPTEWRTASGEELWEQCKEHCASGDYDGAWSFAQNAIERGEVTEEGWELLVAMSTAYQERGEAASGINVAAAARELRPEREESWRCYALALQVAGRFEEAIEALKKVDVLQPYDATLHLALATAYFQAENWVEAAKSARKSVVLDPELAEAWDRLAGALAAGNHLPEAIEACREGIVAHPDHPGLWFKLGVLMFNQDLYEEALAAFLKAKDFTSGNEYTSSYLSLIDIRQGRIPEAVVRLEETLEQQQTPPLFWMAWNELALAYLGRDEYERAAWAGRFATRFGPENFEAWFNLGMAYHFDRKLTDAEDAYQQVVDLEPDCVRALHNLAVIASESGNFRKAREILRKVVELEPDNATAYYDLALALERSGQRAEAAQIRDRAVQLSVESGAGGTMPSGLSPKQKARFVWQKVKGKFFS